jgi:hypothetical protein
MTWRLADAGTAGCLRLSAVLVLALLPGCVTLTPTRAHPDSAVLFSVTLNGDFPPYGGPAGIIVSIEAKQSSAAGQFAFTPYRRVSGHYATFLVRLDLPAGRYGLSRLSAVAADGSALSEFDVAPRMAFEVPAGTTYYVGHIELQSSRGVSDAARAVPHMIIADAYEEELPYFARAWPSLGARAIRRNSLEGSTVIPAVQLGQPPRLASSSSAAVAERAPRLDSYATVGLPRAARAAFQLFLQSRYPRAFAIAVSGSTGMAAGGKDVIGRALSKCKRAQHTVHQASCHLFALDDTLLSAASGAQPGSPPPTADR